MFCNKILYMKVASICSGGHILTFHNDKFFPKISKAYCPITIIISVMTSKLCNVLSFCPQNFVFKEKLEKRLSCGMLFV